MDNFADYTKQEFGDFEIYYATQEQIDGGWRAYVQVYLGQTQLDSFAVAGRHPSKEEAENVAYRLGCEAATKRAAKIQSDEADDGTVLLIGTILYKFPTAAQASAARQWRIDMNASTEEFSARFAQFQLRAFSKTPGSTI